MSASRVDPHAKPRPMPGLAEVRYSLPDLLREIHDERNAPAFAGEQLDQVEISKLFQKNRTRRVSRTRK